MRQKVPRSWSYFRGFDAHSTRAIRLDRAHHRSNYRSFDRDGCAWLSPSNFAAVARTRHFQHRIACTIIKRTERLACSAASSSPRCHGATALTVNVARQTNAAVGVHVSSSGACKQFVFIEQRHADGGFCVHRNLQNANPKPAPAHLNVVASAPRAGSSPFEPAADASSGTSVIGTVSLSLGTGSRLFPRTGFKSTETFAATCMASTFSSPRRDRLWYGVGRNDRSPRRRSGLDEVRECQAPASAKSKATFPSKLAIAEGAEFDGSIQRKKDAKELMPVLDPEAIQRMR